MVEYQIYPLHTTYLYMYNWNMAKILTGTCGFYCTDWLGPVYPAERFGTVELDYTYYSMPIAKKIL
ncbi:hypothetical protein AGMMS49940_23280 [Spirochaetia bacterium]|nr:hypothetical protein AGMMS49940_23280 [Spirochaetia bacterium]